jgi:sugar phosphate isomerase/epimerase
MEIGIFAKTFDVMGARPVLAAAAQAGYSTVQFNMACLGLPSMPDRIAPDVADEVGTASRTAHVSIAAVSGTYNMIHPDKAVRAQGLARLEVLAASCASLGTSLITLCTGTRDAQDQWRWHPGNAEPDAWRDLVTEMSSAIAIADRHDIALGIEPEMANVVSGASMARRLLDEMASPRLRIVLDPANLFETADNVQRRKVIEEAVGLLARDIVMAHAKDRTATGDFTTAGKGVIDFAHFILCLQEAGFDGPLITHGLAAEDAAGVAKFLTSLIKGARHV